MLSAYIVLLLPFSLPLLSSILLSNDYHITDIEHSKLNFKSREVENIKFKDIT